MSATGKPCPACLHDSGFTLLEMMVTVAILALISGIAFPRLQILLARQTMTEARGAVAMAVARARGEAVRRDAPTRLTLASQGNALVMSGLATTPLPAGARLEWPRDGLLIYGDGSANGASGILRAGASASRFSIDPATARLEFAS